MQLQETTFERHYSVDELASIWGVSDDFVRRLFLQNPASSSSSSTGPEGVCTGC